MSTYHSEAIELESGKKHISFLAKQQADTLLIFVHGFYGSANKTWNNFPSQIVEDQHFEKTDVIFYDYPSLKYQAADHASLFYDFLENEIQKATSNLIVQIIKRGLAKRTYDSIVIVGHSLGSIVVREALLMANINKSPWLSKVKTYFFAPAHLGAKIIPLLIEIRDLTIITKMIGAGTIYFVRVLNDLEQGSTILDKIRTDTDSLLKAGGGAFTIANGVAHAAGDAIVTNGRFCQDPVQTTIEGKSHTTICKPDYYYDTPLKKIKELI